MLTVSIVTYRTDSGELRSCLSSLASPLVDRIYIVDNGGEERIRSIASEYTQTTYTALPNPGFGAAHNHAIRLAMEAGSSYHLVLNSDVRFDPAVLGEMLRVMETRPEVGQLQPRIVYPDGTLQPTVRLLPTPLDVFGRRFLPRRLFARRNARYTLEHLDHSRELNVPYHQGSLMLLRTSALREVGLFDERFFMYPEDIDLTRRMHRRHVTLYWPGVTVVHDHRAGSYHNLRLLRIHMANMVRYFNKWGWWRDPERRRFNKPLLPQ